jgi:hypothetical protein
MKKLILLICAGFLFTSAFSQTDVIEVLKAGKDDANVMAKAYLSPYAKALGDGLNNGWYNSAKTHKLFGFDLNVNVSAIQIPKSETTFDLNALGMKNIVPASSSDHIAPTVAGPDQDGPRVLVKDGNGTTVTSFNTPQGAGLDFVPVPMVQVTLGILPHTDLIGRFVPQVKFDDGDDNEMKIGFWGIGVKHNFKEWIPVLKELPFDASIMGSYSQIDAQSEIDVSGYNDGITNIMVDNATDPLLKFTTTTNKYGLILSKKLSVLTLYCAIGHSNSKTAITLDGKYKVVYTATGTVLYELTDPIDVEVSSSSVSMDAGLRLKLGFFSLFGSINKAAYTSYNAGISLGFR